jgi:hypothetical protein
MLLCTFNHLTDSETVFIHYGANLTATENVLIPGATTAFQNSRDGNTDWDWTIYKNVSTINVSMC